MKLRIRGNNLRLRLKRSEVEQSASGQSIVEQACFPDSGLTYRLDVFDDDADTFPHPDSELGNGDQ